MLRSIEVFPTVAPEGAGFRGSGGSFFASRRERTATITIDRSGGVSRGRGWPGPEVDLNGASDHLIQVERG